MPSPPTAAPPSPPPFTAWCTRHFTALTAVVLCLAAVNLGGRLGAEVVTEWDEAMYALSAHEMVSSGRWVATTIHGELDYYNTKPPLNVWLIALSFKAFGTNLASLRLASALAAWLTVWLLVIWARRLCGAPAALVAGIVLSTNFGFIHVHAGRSANADALLTLLILLTVIALWSARDAAWRLVFVPPLIAATFLLKGMSLFLPLAIVLIVETRRWRDDRRRWIRLCAAMPLFFLPVSLWAVLRWRIDGWTFLHRVLVDDVVGHTLGVLDGHGRGALFYLNELQKQEYGWLLLAGVALFWWRPRWSQARTAIASSSADLRLLLGAWGLVTLLVPTLMRTKLPWYLNPFYPAFALLIGWILTMAMARIRTRTQVMAFVVLWSFVVAAGEARLFWYSYAHRNLATSSQGLLLSEAGALRGHVLYAAEWSNAERFVVQALIGGEPRQVAGLAEFLECSMVGDYLFWPAPVVDRTTRLVRMAGSHRLYRRQAATDEEARLSSASGSVR